MSHFQVVATTIAGSAVIILLGVLGKVYGGLKALRAVKEFVLPSRGSAPEKLTLEYSEVRGIVRTTGGKARSAEVELGLHNPHDFPVRVKPELVRISFQGRVEEAPIRVTSGLDLRPNNSPAKVKTPAVDLPAPADDEIAGNLEVRLIFGRIGADGSATLDNSLVLRGKVEMHQVQDHRGRRFFATRWEPDLNTPTPVLPPDTTTDASGNEFFSPKMGSARKRGS